MHRNLMIVKRTAEKLVDEKVIDDFELDHTRVAPRIRIRIGDRWDYVTFSLTPRTGFADNYLRQQIHRKKDRSHQNNV